MRDGWNRRGRRFATRASIDESTSAFFRSSLRVSSRSSEGSIASSRPSIHRSVGYDVSAICRGLVIVVD